MKTMLRRGLYVRGFYVLAALTLALSLAVAGCSKQASLPANGGQVQVNQNNGGTTRNTNQDTAQAGGTIQWPSQMPPDVPRFTYGTITGSSNNVMGSIQAAFANVTPDVFDKYQSDLKKAGWTISNATQSADGFEIDAAKAPRGVVAMFITSKNNGLKGAVTYNDHSGQ
jgi:hypothetical protein